MRIEKNVDICDYGPTSGTVLAFVWDDWSKIKNLSWDSQSHDLNTEPPEYEAGMLIERDTNYHSSFLEWEVLSVRVSSGIFQDMFVTCFTALLTLLNLIK